MEAEQRRAVALAQRQKRIQPQALGLLIAEIGGQQRAQFATVEATITCPGVTCRASWRLSCAARASPAANGRQGRRNRRRYRSPRSPAAG